MACQGQFGRRVKLSSRLKGSVGQPNLFSHSAKESTTAGPPLIWVKADICSANESVGDQIRPQITARRKMQLAGCRGYYGPWYRCGTWKWRPRTLTKTSRCVWSKRYA